MNFVPFSIFRNTVSTKRLVNVRSFIFLTINETENHVVGKSVFRCLATGKGESSAPSVSSSSSSSSSSSDSSDSSDSSSDDEEEVPQSDDTKDKKAVSSITHERLNGLLQSMIKQSGSVSSILLKEMDINKGAESVTQDDSKKSERKSKMIDHEVEKAARNVAESLGGDVKKTESELLSKLLSHDNKNQMPDVPKNASINLSDLIGGMKIDRTPASRFVGDDYPSSRRVPGEQPRAQGSPVSRTEREPRFQQSISARLRSRMPESKVDLFGETKLGIFNPSSDYISMPPLKTWNHLHQRQLTLSVAHPPSNIFEEMILWTDKGMLWKFPINNEQGLEEEAKVPFTEHVFLEKHLSPWCPRKGPIRHFMELICVGLSNNSYLRIEEKKETILWYRDYFQKKQDILKSAGVDIEMNVKQVDTN